MRVKFLNISALLRAIIHPLSTSIGSALLAFGFATDIVNSFVAGISALALATVDMSTRTKK